jgi:hypothetical protein
VEEGTDAVEAEVEVVMAITRMATMAPHLQILPITAHHNLPTTTDAVEYPTTTHKDTPRILLGHHHSNSTAVATVQAVLGHSHHPKPTAGTLTQMAVAHHRGQFRARMAGVDITLGPQVEADMVAAAMVVPEADMAAEVAATEVMDTDMAEEEASIIIHHMRADIVLVAMTVAIVLGVADRREDVAEAEVSDALASDFDVNSQHFLSLFAYPAY